MVGTDQGVVHKQRQGTGLATILGPNIGLPAFLQVQERKRQLMASKAAERAALAKAAKDELTAFNPERWYTHENEIRDRQNKWMEEGANLMATGDNPFTSQSEQARKFRQEKDRIETLATQSMQVKKMYEQFTQQLNNDKDAEYDPGVIQAYKDFFQKPISEIVDNRLMPPPLLKRKPTLDLQNKWNGVMSDIDSKLVGKELTDSDKWKIVDETNSASGADLENAYASYFAYLPDYEKQRIEDASHRTGKSISQVIGREFLDRYKKGKEPLNLDKLITDAAKGIDTTTVEYRGVAGGSKRLSQKDTMRSINAKAELMISDPEVLYEYQKIIPIPDGMNEMEYKEIVSADISKKMWDLVGKDRASFQTEAGKGEADVTASGKLWLQDMMSGQKSREDEAAGYTLFTKGVLSGLNVDKAFVTSDAFFPKVLAFEIAGSPDMKTVKDTFINPETGLTEQDVQFKQSQDRVQITIPINKDTENALLRIHDLAFKSGGRKYEGSGQTWNLNSLSSPQQPGQKVPPAVKSQF